MRAHFSRGSAKSPAAAPDPPRRDVIDFPGIRCYSSLTLSRAGGRFIEELGIYNPLVEPAEVRIDADRAKDWMQKGAQPTDTVRRLMKNAGIL